MGGSREGDMGKEDMEDKENKSQGGRQEGQTEQEETEDIEPQFERQLTGFRTVNQHVQQLSSQCQVSSARAIKGESREECTQKAFDLCSVVFSRHTL